MTAGRTVMFWVASDYLYAVLAKRLRDCECLVCLVGDPETPRLVALKSGQDYTERMQTWALERLEELAEVELSREEFYRRLPDCDPPPTTAIYWYWATCTGFGGSSV